MRRFLMPFVFIASVALLATPAFAQPDIPAGPDFWATGSSGLTYFTFLDGDVESLCGKPHDPSWDHQVRLVGVPLSSDEDYDTVVKRVDDAKFPDCGGAVNVDIVVTDLQMKSLAPQNTPCGQLTWQVKLSGPQRTNKMTIVRSDANGGVFFATLSLDVEMVAIDASGNVLGSLFQSFDLPDPAGSTGTPWSYGGPFGWMPGRSTAGDCVGSLRKKLENTPKESGHYYCLSEAIASGNCNSKCLRG